MTKRHVRLLAKVGAAVAGLALIVSGCSAGAGTSGGKTITIGAVQGWSDQIGTAYLFKNILQKKGYTVNIQSLSDNAPLFAGMASGAVDIMGSAWPERTHKAYMAKYGSQVEDLDTFYHGASLYLAVPTYSDIHSIADLPSHAAEFGHQIIGIEPGAGLTKLTQENVFPQYGLSSNYNLVLSSTTAMVTELKKATSAKQPIVVTLWKPFWANQSFPVRPLEDPKHAYGTTESLHTLAHKGFSQEHPDVANMIKNFKLTDAQYGSLENDLINKFGQGKEDQAIAAWLKDNPGYAENLAKYLTS